MNEYISPGVIITILIIFAISIWLLIGRLWKSPIVDNNVRREKLFKYLDAIGLVLSSRGNDKTVSLYYKSYMEFLVTVKSETSMLTADFYEKIVNKIHTGISSDEINHSVLKLLNCIRKEYKIDKSIMKVYIADLSKKSAQQGDAPEPASPAR